jgi:hypothetical protein
MSTNPSGAELLATLDRMRRQAMIGRAANSAISSNEFIQQLDEDRAVLTGIADLLGAGERVTAAFRALGKAAPGINSLLAHKECETSILALNAAIRAMRGES